MAGWSLLVELDGRDGVFARRINVEVAGHSPIMDRVMDELRAQFAPVRPRPVRIPMLSTVTLSECAGEV